MGDVIGELREADVATGSARCRRCGCTQSYGCNPPCWWIESDLCSSCALTFEDDDG